MNKLIIVCLLAFLGLAPSGAGAQTANVDFDTQFGGRGDGVTDNTAALNAYYAWACTQPAAITNHIVMRPGAVFHGAMAVTGGGRYLFTGTINPVRCPGVGLVGQPGGTVFVMHTASPFLSAGTFTTAPQNYYVGGAQDYTVRDIQCLDDRSLAQGARVATCVQDNGSGGGNIRDLRCFGVKYCFNAPYGSDLTDITREYVESSDVGVYLGPGSQQVNIHQFHCGPVVECSVMEGASHVVFDGAPDFNACGYSGTTNHNGACMTFEANLATTRQGVRICPVGGTPPCAGYAMDMEMNVYGPWFESNAGGLGNQPLYFIRFQGGQTSDAMRGLFIHDAYILNGGYPVPGSAFIGSTMSIFPRRIYLQQADLQGNQFQSWFYNAGVTFNDLRVANGYPALPLLQTSDAASTLNDATSYIGVLPTTGYWVRGTCVRNMGMALAAGRINWGFCRLSDGTKVQSNIAGTDWSAVFGTAQ